jgi:hypothetical protein
MFAGSAAERFIECIAGKSDAPAYAEMLARFDAGDAPPFIQRQWSRAAPGNLEVGILADVIKSPKVGNFLAVHPDVAAALKQGSPALGNVVDAAVKQGRKRAMEALTTSPNERKEESKKAQAFAEIMHFGQEPMRALKQTVDAHMGIFSPRPEARAAVGNAVQQAASNPTQLAVLMQFAQLGGRHRALVVETLTAAIHPDAGTPATRRAASFVLHHLVSNGILDKAEKNQILDKGLVKSWTKKIDRGMDRMDTLQMVDEGVHDPVLRSALRKVIGQKGPYASAVAKSIGSVMASDVKEASANAIHLFLNLDKSKSLSTEAKRQIRNSLGDTFYNADAPFWTAVKSLPLEKRIALANAWPPLAGEDPNALRMNLLLGRPCLTKGREVDRDVSRAMESFLPKVHAFSLRGCEPDANGAISKRKFGVIQDRSNGLKRDINALSRPFADSSKGSAKADLCQAALEYARDQILDVGLSTQAWPESADRANMASLFGDIVDSIEELRNELAEL